MVGERIVEEENQPVAEVTPQPEVITQEKYDADLKAAKEEAKEAAWEKYQGIQKTIAKKDDEIRRLRETTVKPNGMTQILLDEMRARQVETGETNPRIAALEREIAQEKLQEAENQRLATQTRIVAEEWEELESTAKEAGYDINDPKFNDIVKTFEEAKNTGMFERAHRKMDRILRTTTKEPVKQTIEPPQDIDTKAEARANEILKEKYPDLFKSDNNSSSGSSQSDTEFKRAWGSGELAKTKANFERARKIEQQLE